MSNKDVNESQNIEALSEDELLEASGGYWQEAPVPHLCQYPKYSKSICDSCIYFEGILLRPASTPDELAKCSFHTGRMQFVP